MTTLKEAIKSLSAFVTPMAKGNLSRQLLGKYKGIIPKGISSSAWIKKLRANLYGKIK